MSFRWNELTGKERAIARRIASGEKAYSIERDLGLSRSGLAYYRKMIYRILDVSDRTELALLLGKHWEEVQPKVRSLKAVS